MFFKAFCTVLVLVPFSLSAQVTRLETAETTQDETTIPGTLTVGLYYQKGPGSATPMNWQYVYGTKLTVNGGSARNFELCTIGKDNYGIAMRQYSQDQSAWTTWKRFLLDDANGNFGIGTNVPTRMLDVDGTLRIREGSWFEGNVGIGTELTSNPNSYKLAVNGTIGAKKVKVETTSTAWSDFVFSDTFQLRPIEEVRSFIDLNKHLPDIPSAEDVEKNGIDLGEMDAKLLQKVEELTLYLMDVKEEVKDLKKQNELLKEKNEKLEKLLQQLLEKQQ